MKAKRIQPEHEKSFSIRRDHRSVLTIRIFGRLAAGKHMATFFHQEEKTASKNTKLLNSTCSADFMF